MSLDQTNSHTISEKMVSKLSKKVLKAGHRRVHVEGEISYKKIPSAQIIASVQLGISYSLRVMCNLDKRDLLMQDFETIEQHNFPKIGGFVVSRQKYLSDEKENSLPLSKEIQKPKHNFHDFKFKTLAPLAFRHFYELFGVKDDEIQTSLCNEPLKELENSGESTSIFYLSSDDNYIFKIVSNEEANFFQKLLPEYYMKLNQNPDTLLPKYFGMFEYQCNTKKIRLALMNNIIPSNVKIHLKFDLKGSTLQRKACKREITKACPTFKDNDFLDLLPEGISLDSETYDALISTLRRDLRVLESLGVVDYSLLLGIHNIDLNSKGDDVSSSVKNPTKVDHRNSNLTDPDDSDGSTSPDDKDTENESTKTNEYEDVIHGGIKAKNHKGEQLILYLGIIDTLQYYGTKKKLEHTAKKIFQSSGSTVQNSPESYSFRFLNFMADNVFKKISSSAFIFSNPYSCQTACNQTYFQPLKKKALRTMSIPKICISTTNLSTLSSVIESGNISKTEDEVKEVAEDILNLKTNEESIEHPNGPNITSTNSS